MLSENEANKLLLEEFGGYTYTSISEYIENGLAEVVELFDNKYEINLPDKKELYIEGLNKVATIYEDWCIPSGDWRVGLKSYINLMKKHNLSFVNEQDTYHKALKESLVFEPYGRYNITSEDYLEVAKSCGINIRMPTDYDFYKSCVDLCLYENDKGLPTVIKKGLEHCNDPRIVNYFISALIQSHSKGFLSDDHLMNSISLINNKSEFITKESFNSIGALIINQFKSIKIIRDKFKEHGINIDLKVKVNKK